MSGIKCSPFDLKDYFFGELRQDERRSVDQHVAECAACREELHTLKLTRTALMAVPEQEPPRRIAFVSDKVFEPGWWQRIWNSTPQLGFVSACILAVAIGVHAFQTQPARGPVAPVQVAQMQISQAQIDAEVGKRIDVAVLKAVAESEERQAEKLLQVVNVRLRQTEMAHRADLLTVKDYLVRMHKEGALVRRAAYDSRGLVQ